MKRNFISLFMAVTVTLICCNITFATGNNEYPNGIEGIKAASVPPPGFYYKMYNVIYSADSSIDKDGKENVGLKDFSLNLFANAHRFLLVSKKKFLGASLGADIIIPLMNVDLEVSPKGLPFTIADNEFAPGDICFEPLVMAWHGSQYDLAFAAGFYAPTGKYSLNSDVNPGKGMWTGMFTFGGTVYFDKGKTWSASALSRYEIHGEKDVLVLNNLTDVYEKKKTTPGNDYHIEWGFAKTIAKIVDVGISGYCQWQTTRDTGQGKPGEDKDRVYAVGPEISIFVPPLMTNFNLRALWEFEAKDRTEGVFVSLVYTKIF